MGRPRKRNSVGQKAAQFSVFVKSLDYVALVELVRKSRSKDKSNTAFNEIETRMSVKIKQISGRFRIPGFSFADVYQESLFALRYKAIKDYDKERGNDTGPYPFDKFAVLCIRRHLSTQLKSSFQNKKRVLNSSLSLNQDRNESSEENLYLSDILPKTEGTILEEISHDENFKLLMNKLFSKLSKFEKEVFLLYVQKNSYEQISYIINKRIKESKKGKAIDVKSVDNALSRIKGKAKEIFNKMEID